MFQSNNYRQNFISILGGEQFTNLKNFYGYEIQNLDDDTKAIYEQEQTKNFQDFILTQNDADLALKFQEEEYKKQICNLI
ncbi:unnamed protein product [Paramecium sonneborni]|uniref:Uncharacterized protein n=1 Tax=Paramecium sonneborni TaxID=65129 RepID=A0A8S1PJG5_9CILI|nr:unnamed protein product [Paramecium sonneborni]